MKVWFTADTHFGHANIIKYCQRPHLSAEEKRLAASDVRGRWRVSEATVRRHDEELLDAINSRVDKRDLLWVVGDFCMGGRQEAAHYRDLIRCQDVRLVWGNHDRRSNGGVFREAIEQGMIRVGDQQVWLCHYPCRSWDKRFHGTWHFYGHVHGRLQAEDEANPSWLVKDVGVDACEYRPWSFEELREYMAPRLDAFYALKQAAERGEDVELA
jgi:calcineurin-like phosphoesterase family protein